MSRTPTHFTITFTEQQLIDIMEALETDAIHYAEGAANDYVPNWFQRINALYRKISMLLPSDHSHFAKDLLEYARIRKHS